MPSPRLLLIDDDDLSRSLLELHLSADDFDLLVFESGEAALDHLAATPEPHLAAALTDMQMPGLCGPALAAALRPLLAPATPLFAMSGSQPPPDRLTGYDAFLLKPFTPADLRSLLDTAPAPASVAPVLQTSLLDDATFNTLLGYLTPPQQAELLTLCFSELRRHLDKMHAAQRIGDLAAIRHSAHAAKGSFAMIGARELQLLCGDLETNCPLAPADQAASLAQIESAGHRLAGILSTRGFVLVFAPPSAQPAP